ncbi:MAG: hypothetical protein ACUVS2_01310 [Candidatus Flexifilum sp.]|jgi:uncharacterized membrane protein YhaH (DUF805 family)
MSSQVKVAGRARRRWAWPVVGFILAVSLGVIAYMLAPTVIQLLRTNLRGFDTSGMAPTTLRWIFTAILFVIFITLAGLIVAVAAPKPRDTVKYSDLVKEREAMQAERKRKKIQARRLAQQMREENRKRQR